MALPTFAPLLAQAQGTDGFSREAVLRLARQLFVERHETSITTMVLVLLAGIAIQVLAYWIAAKVVVGNEQGTFARAVYLWLLSVLAGIGLGIVLLVCIGLAASTGQPMMLLLVVGGWLLLAFTIGLLLPAKVFETDLLRSLGILVLSFVLVLAGQTALDQALGRSMFARWRPLQRLIFDSNEGRQRRLKHLLNDDPLVTIESDLDRLASPAERRKSFGERQEGLRLVFAALEQRRKSIKAGDNDALASYEAARQRYEELVKNMRDDYAASQPPATPAAR